MSLGHRIAKNAGQAALIYGVLMLIAFFGAIAWAYLDPSVMLPAR